VSAHRVAVAYSGGRDSTALLHATLAAAQTQGANVIALHVHHGLSAKRNAPAGHARVGRSTSSRNAWKTARPLVRASRLGRGERAITLFASWPRPLKFQPCCWRTTAAIRLKPCCCKPCAVLASPASQACRVAWSVRASLGCDPGFLARATRSMPTCGASLADTE
jgi:hypothetical protein